MKLIFTLICMITLSYSANSQIIVNEVDITKETEMFDVWAFKKPLSSKESYFIDYGQDGFKIHNYDTKKQSIFNKDGVKFEKGEWIKLVKYLNENVPLLVDYTRRFIPKYRNFYNTLSEKGKFVKGNEGKPKGALSEKTKLWHMLGEFITNRGAMLYTQNLVGMMESHDPKERLAGMAMYKDTIEFFKPKLSRVDQNNTGEQQMNISVTYADQPNNPEVPETSATEQP